MSNSEFLMLQPSLDQKRNVEVSVVFTVEPHSTIQPAIPPRNVDLNELMALVQPEPFPMDFDEHPYWVRRIEIDQKRRKATIHAVSDPSMM